MIDGLVQRVNQTQLPEKDTEAESLLMQGLARNPDALYIMAQTILVQKYALEQAQSQLTQAKGALDEARKAAADAANKPHTSFLGSLLGQDRSSAPPPPPPAPQGGYAPVYAGQQTGYAMPQPGYGQPQYSQPQYGQPQYGPGPGMGGGGGFLQGAMQTAAGVAAGALAFEGIESLMHGFEHHAGYESRGFEDRGFEDRGNLSSGGNDDYRAFENNSGDSNRFANDGNETVADSTDGSNTADDYGTDDSSNDSSGDSSDFSSGDDDNS